MRDGGLRSHLVADAFAPPLALAGELPMSTGRICPGGATLGDPPLVQMPELRAVGRLARIP